MRRIVFVLTAIVGWCGSVAAAVEEPVVEISTKIANQGSYVTGYDKSFKLAEPGSSLSWTAQNFNNNNSAWDNIRCGSKSSATTATITTDFAIEEAIGRVDVELSRYKTGSSNRMTSMALLVSPNADMSEATSYAADISALPTTTGTPVVISIPVAEPADNMYYQLKVEMPKVSSEGVFSVNWLKYYAVPREIPAGEHSVMLDFTDKQALLAVYTGASEIAPGGEYSESATNNLNGATFEAGLVSVSFDKAAGTIQPRWWESKTISPELRLNPDNVITVEATSKDVRLLQVRFFQGNANKEYYDNLKAAVETNLGVSELTDKTWTAPADGRVDKVTMTIGADYCRCGMIEITYFDEAEGAGIKDVSADRDGDDESAEYYDLRGVKVDGSNLSPGIYIMRRGATAAKVYVK